MMGKGSGRRPTEIEEDEFEDNWEVAFRRSDKNQRVMKPKPKKEEGKLFDETN